MKLFFVTPQSVYVPNLGCSFIGNLNASRNFNIFNLRDTETETETKFLMASSTPYLPFDLDFLKQYFSNIYLENTDGSYKSKLFIKTNADGTQYGYPMQTMLSGKSYISTYHFLYPYNFVDLITEDGEWCIWFSSIGLGDFCDRTPPRALPLNYTAKKIVQMVLTKATDYHKQLGVAQDPNVDNTTTNVMFLNNTKFYYGNYESLDSSSGYVNFIDYENTSITPFKITYDYSTANKSMNLIGYNLTNSKLVWIGDTVQPPQGYELEYDLKTAEQWKAVNSLTTDYQVYRIPPWSGNRCIYLFTYGSSAYFKTQRLSILKYSDEDKKWFIYSNGIPIYECNTQVEYFDNTQTYHFDFIGTLSEDEKQEIADGLDFSLNRFLDLTQNANSINCYDGDRESIKQIIKNYKIETGAPTFTVFDQPIFI